MTAGRRCLDVTFAALKRHAVAREPSLRLVRLVPCAEADREHAASARQFMHVGHRRNVVCFARATEALDFPWQVGLVAHELGHLAAIGWGLADHYEEDANRIGGDLCGVTVTFAGPLRLERAEPPAYLRAYA